MKASVTAWSPGVAGSDASLRCQSRPVLVRSGRRRRGWQAWDPRCCSLASPRPSPDFKTIRAVAVALSPQANSQCAPRRGAASFNDAVPKMKSAAPEGCLLRCCPLQRFQMCGSDSEVASPRLRRPLMRFSCSPECYECCRTEPFGLSRTPPRSHCFQPTPAVFLAAPVPVHLRFRVHPLVSLASSSEYVSASNLPADRSRRTPSLGLRSTP